MWDRRFNAYSPRKEVYHSKFQHTRGKNAKHAVSNPSTSDVQHSQCFNNTFSTHRAHRSPWIRPQSGNRIIWKKRRGSHCSVLLQTTSNHPNTDIITAVGGRISWSSYSSCHPGSKKCILICFTKCGCSWRSWCRR